METTPEEEQPIPEDVQGQPLRGVDATAETAGAEDPAQEEWERTRAVDEGSADSDEATATGADPQEIPDADDQIPSEDLPGSAAQPETQGEDPVIIELGEDGEGDLSPGDY